MITIIQDPKVVIFMGFNIYVVLQFILCFVGMVMYDNEFETKENEI